MLAKPLFLVVALLVITSVTYGQSKKKKSPEPLLTAREAWYQGSILLNDHTELKGVLKYDNRAGLLHFQSGTDSKSFIPRSVVAFEFFDESIQKQRVFYTFDHTDEQTDIVRPHFFELIRQFKSFSVWKKYSHMEIKQKRKYMTPLQVIQPTSAPDGEILTDAEQNITIFLMGDDNKPEPYLRISVSEQMEKTWWYENVRTKSKLTGQDILIDYVGQETYKKLKEYAKAEGLKFSREDDLMKILAHYESNFQ